MTRTHEYRDFNNLKEWITPLLEKKGMSIEELANKTTEAGFQLTKTAIYYWMEDKCRPSETSMAAICKVLGRPFEEGLRQYTPRKAGRPVGYSPGKRSLTAGGRKS
jgi:transcriptional regulator with XRE-family HTH domain